MSLKINERDTVSRRVDLLWPKPDTRVPEHQRQKPVLEGHVDCEYVYMSQDDAEELDAKVESGEMTHAERFQKIVVEIRGLPTAPDQSAHDWIDNHKYGSVVRSAIWQDYLAHLGEGRQGNSKRRR